MPGPRRDRLRVVTWNAWWRFGDWRRRRDAIAAVLRTVDPDVVGLQEAWAGPDGNLAEWLAGELGLHWAYAAVPDASYWQRRTGEPDVSAGNAVLSRGPILATAELVLPAPGGYAERTALHARLDVGPVEVPFFVTHLHHPMDGSAARCDQVRALVPFLAEHRAGPFPAVLAGDFNCEPDADEMRLLNGHLTAPVVPGEVLVDAWRWAPPGVDGDTWSPRNPHVGAHWSLGARIDRLHVGPPGPDRLGEVTAVRLVGDQPVGGVWPSDHFGVLADLRLPYPPAPADG